MLWALSREPAVLDSWLTEVGAARGGDARLDRPDGRLPAGVAAGARRPARVPDAFCASRLAGGHDGTYGMLAGNDLRALVERATPTAE